MRNFKEYDIWKDAIGIGVIVYKITSDFPDHQKFALSSQLQRAALSISSNIAEGCGRSSPADFARMLDIALGSAYEVQSQLFLATELQYITKEQSLALEASIEKLQRQIHSLINKLRNK
jgi:four helix bundle protein